MCGVDIGAPSLCTTCLAVGTLPPSWCSSRGGEDPRPDQSPILLAGGEESRGGLLPQLPGVSDGGAKATFSQSLGSHAYHFSPFQQDRHGPGGTFTQEQPRTPIYPGDSGLRHQVPGGHSPAHHGYQGDIARELVMLFSRVGLPDEILTDQGTPFMSRIMKDLCKLMKITQLRTSVYHPQTDGLV